MQWSQLANLSEIHLAGNALYGSIPWTGNASFSSPLRIVDVTGSSLSGRIPLSLLLGAEELLLSGNWLTGTLPTELSAAQRLRRLEVEGTMMLGAIPHLANVTTLQELNLFAGFDAPLPELPPGIAKVAISVLTDAGALPAQWAALANLTSLRLRAASFGALPAAWGSWTRLAAFDLSLAEVWDVPANSTVINCELTTPQTAAWDEPQYKSAWRRQEGLAGCNARAALNP